jgi:phage gp46-like protein
MDFALTLLSDGTGADLALTPQGDLALDAGLTTCVILSLLCDRLADPDDVIPDGSSNRRGWWGDAYLPPLPDGSAMRLGSKLWLRTRMTETQRTAKIIQADIAQALAWMTITGLASAINISFQFVGATGVQYTVAIVQPGPSGSATAIYTVAWNFSLGVTSVTQG